jgi:hypothetical protein
VQRDKDLAHSPFGEGPLNQIGPKAFHGASLAAGFC